MRSKELSVEVKGIVRRAQRQDCVEAQIWGRVQKHFYIIEGPQEHSGILKWKRCGTTKTLSLPFLKSCFCFVIMGYCV
jgi:hypothetical protein